MARPQQGAPLHFQEPCQTLDLLLQVAAPRKFQLEQHWRREDDGSYIILFNSTHSHAQAIRPPGKYWSWYNPVEAKVISPSPSRA